MIQSHSVSPSRRRTLSLSKGTEVPSQVVERARCDAQEIGRIDDDKPARTKTPVSAARRRQVWRRDEGRCKVSGCRSTRHLDIHHLKPRAQGGDHRLNNLCLLCGGHHDATHDGELIIEGSIEAGLVFRHADGNVYGAPPPTDVVADATRALCNAGFTPSAAHAAVQSAQSHVGPGAGIEAILQRALRALRPGAG